MFSTETRPRILKLGILSGAGLAVAQEYLQHIFELWAPIPNQSSIANAGILILATCSLMSLRQTRSDGSPRSETLHGKK